MQFAVAGARTAHNIGPFRSIEPATNQPVLNGGAGEGKGKNAGLHCETVSPMS